MNARYHRSKTCFLPPDTWRCVCTRSHRQYLPCDKPVTHVVQGQDDYGYRRIILVCSKHAAIAHRDLQRMDWNGVEVFDIENSDITISDHQITIHLGQDILHSS
jgi:hypothetical protein